MQETAKSAPPGSVRVVTTSSSAAFLYQNKDIDYTTLKEGESRTKLGTHNLYAQSKVASSLVSTELGRRYAPDGIISISVNPGTSVRCYKELISNCILQETSAPTYSVTSRALASGCW